MSLFAPSFYLRAYDQMCYNINFKKHRKEVFILLNDACT